MTMIKKYLLTASLLGLLASQVLGQPGNHGKTHDVSRLVRQLALANNYFAVQLHNAVAGEDNVFFSPFSITNALGMLYLGARGDTAKELSRALGFDKANLNDQQVHSAFDDVLSLVEGTQGGYQLDVANRALTGEKLSFPILQSYQNALRKYYHAEIERVNFAEDAEDIMDKINEWVNEKTNGKIEKLLEEPLDEFTALVLLNAVYFKGTWQTQFDPKDTLKSSFRNHNGETKQVPMMHLEERFNMSYSEELQSEILELPYSGQDVSMYVVLPVDQNGIRDLERKLSVEALTEAIQKKREQKINVFLPKFKLEQEYDLNPVLRKTGIRKALNGEADLSGMTGHQDLFVSKTMHKAVIEVNEEGSEAAAVTGVVIESRMGGLRFVVDHPFMFFIVDNRTGMTLFVGSVKNL